LKSNLNGERVAHGFDQLTSSKWKLNLGHDQLRIRIFLERSQDNANHCYKDSPPRSFSFTTRHNTTQSQPHHHLLQKSNDRWSFLTNVDITSAIRRITRQSWNCFTIQYCIDNLPSDVCWSILIKTAYFPSRHQVLGRLYVHKRYKRRYFFLFHYNCVLLSCPGNNACLWILDTVLLPLIQQTPVWAATQISGFDTYQDNNVQVDLRARLFKRNFVTNLALAYVGVMSFS
jgi:hypothetical protein